MRHPLALLLTSVIAFGAPAALAATPAPLTQKTDKAKKPETEKERKQRLDAKATEVAKTLRKKLTSKEANERSEALSEAAATDHRTVVAAMAKALGDESEAVRRTTLELFGTMRDPAAKKACMTHARSARKALAKDPDTMVILLRSVGHHADPKTIDWLIDDAFLEKDRSIRRARLFSASKPRTKESLEAIMKGLARTDTKLLRARFREARIALVWLTGKDHGADHAAWSAWWRKEGKDFKVPVQPPKMQEEMHNEWRGFWGDRRVYDRQKKRGDRG